MKKLLGIVVLGLLWCNISFADQDYRIKNFTQWLYENGHNQYLEKDSDGRLQTNLKIRLNKKKDPLIINQTQTETRYFIIYGTRHMHRESGMRLNLLKNLMNLNSI